MRVFFYVIKFRYIFNKTLALLWSWAHVPWSCAPGVLVLAYLYSVVCVWVQETLKVKNLVTLTEEDWGTLLDAHLFSILC